MTADDTDRIAKLRDLADLRDRGALTDEEFASEKTRLLAGTTPAAKAEVRPAFPRATSRPLDLPPRAAAGGEATAEQAALESLERIVHHRFAGETDAQFATRLGKHRGAGLSGKQKTWLVVGVLVVIAFAVGEIQAGNHHPASKTPAGATAETTAAVRQEWETPGVCGDGGAECVPASDVSMSSGVVDVQTDWLLSPLVTADAAGGGEVNPGDISLAAQLCMAGLLAGSLAAGNASVYVPVEVYGQGNADLAWSNSDGTCSSA